MAWLLGSTPGVRKPAKAPRPYQQQSNPLAFNPGMARCPVKIAATSANGDAFGQQVPNWVTYLETYCEIRQLSGQELYQGSEFTSAAQYRIRMRWPGEQITVNVGDRVFFEKHVYTIQIVNNVLMRNTILELTCLEIDGSS